MELRDYLRAIRRSWLLIVVLVIVGGAGGFGVSKVQAPSYSATSTAYISARSAASLGDAAAGATYVQQAVQSYAQIATTAYVLKPVIAKLGLDTTADTLAQRITTTTSTTTALLQISVKDADPTEAAAIANAVAQQLRVAAVNLTPAGGTTPATSAEIKLTVVDPAVTPSASVNPSAAVLAGGGAAAGLVLAVIIGLLRELFDTRIRTTDDVTRATELPLLGTIRRDSETPHHPLAVLDSARSARAEAYRTLRTNLRYVELDDAARSLVVTSSLDGEGKSTTAANLALAAAGLGQRVLLVDADLRRPRIGALFGVEDSVGMTDVLIGSVTVEEAVQDFGQTGLRVLPAGAVPPNPNEILQSQAMADLLDTLHAEYDLIIFDSPPLLVVSDAAVLAGQTGGVILVAASGQVRRAQLESAVQSLERVHARVAGVVVTMVPRTGPDAYGYGYGVTAETAKTKRGQDARLQARRA